MIQKHKEFEWELETICFWSLDIRGNYFRSKWRYTKLLIIILLSNFNGAIFFKLGKYHNWSEDTCL